MFNRAEIIDENFTKVLSEGNFPSAQSPTNPIEAQLSQWQFLDLLETQFISRHLDLRARILKNEGKCYYTIGSSGHEGNAAIGLAFRTTDMAFLHYRSCALMIQRAKQKPGTTPLYDNMLSFFAAIEEPIAGGRHKVFGSLDLFVPPQTSTIASHLPKAVGAAFSIGKAKHLNLSDRVLPDDSVIICSFGDASINHSTAVGAVNAACWMAQQNIPLPIVFVCEDNGIGISVPTPTGWVANTYGQKHGLKYMSCDGLNLCDVYKTGKEAAEFARENKRPVFLHVKTLRLMGHAGSDMEFSYHNLQEIVETEKQDPLLHSARIACENAFATPQEILQIYESTRRRVQAVSDYCEKRPQLDSSELVRSTLTACTHKKKAPKPVTSEDLGKLFGEEFEKLQQPLHLAKLLNMALHETMLRYPQSLIFGEDVAKKGGVYNVTENLHKRFGAKRIFNSLLDETTILGTAMGLAHNGFLPIPEIQFLAYYHNAEDQIRGEASTLAFFSKGQYTNPMVVRIAGLAYQKGFGGHFHNDNSLAALRDIPGLVLAVPSNGADAVKMFRRICQTAYEDGRVAIFIEPIALYMTRDLHEANDKAWCFPFPSPEEQIELGEIGQYGEGKDLCILSYGNGIYHSRQAVLELEKKHRVKSTLVDLRWLAPVKWDLILDAVKPFRKILFVDECRKTGSFSEQIIAGLAERLQPFPQIQILAADDCFIPLGPASAAGLPKKGEIIKAALTLMERKI